MSKNTEEVKKTNVVNLKVITDFEEEKLNEVPADIKAKYPNAHFCAVPNVASVIRQYQGRGYEIVKRDNASISGEDVDDTIRNGDTILMACHIETYKALLKKPVVEQDARLKHGNQNQISSINKLSKEDLSTTEKFEVKSERS